MAKSQRRGNKEARKPKATKPQVAAFARAKHQPMRSETDQPPVAVSCPVTDLERNHRRILAPIWRTSFNRPLPREPATNEALRRRSDAFSYGRRLADRVDER